MVFKRGIAAALLAASFMGVMGADSFAADDDRIIDGVFIDDLNVSGMTYDEAKKAVKKKVEELQNEKVTIQVGEDSLDVTMADLGLQWKNRDIVKEAVQIGNSGNLIKRYKDEKDLENGSTSFDLVFYGNENSIRDFIVEDCKQFEKEPQQASIESDGSAGVNLQPGVIGQKIDVEASVKAIQDYIASMDWATGSDRKVELSVELEKPDADMHDLEQITDVLGTYTTYYGSTYGRNTNVERGAELINGHLILPGESFSVCDHLVPFSAENGYELGGAYENGRVVQEYGGGICQVSTTLYNALLLAEIEIDERHNHTMSVSYVPTSMDAAIAEGSMDLVFTNDKDTPIFISGYAYGGELTFTVWGKEDRPADRYVEYYSEQTGTIDASTAIELYPADDQYAGYIAQVQFASPGSEAVLWKYVTYNGETTVEQVNSSTYEATPNAYEVGTIGATDVLLNAIYNNDLATAQLAATGSITIPTPGVTVYDQTQQQVVTDPSQTVTDPAQTIDGTVNIGGTAGGYYTDTPQGEVWVPDATYGYTDYGYTDGVVTW